MARTRSKQAQASTNSPRVKALNPEARENQLVALAYDVAEQQLRDGTISSQVLTQLIRSGSIRGRAELLKLERENELLRAKTESLQAAQRTDEIYKDALKAMQNYSGMETIDDQDVR